MVHKHKKTNGSLQFIAVTSTVLLLILLGVGIFTYRLYERIVDESKTLAWEMTLKSASVLEMRLNDIRTSVVSLANEISLRDISVEDADRLTSYELGTDSIFHLYILNESGIPLAAKSTLKKRRHRTDGALPGRWRFLKLLCRKKWALADGHCKNHIDRRNSMPSLCRMCAG